MSTYILRAAVILADEKYQFTGKNHAECLSKLKSASRQGFITNTNRFVTREEALEIAIEAGQSIYKHNPKSILLSEDLSEDKLYNH